MFQRRFRARLSGFRRNGGVSREDGKRPSQQEIGGEKGSIQIFNGPRQVWVELRVCMAEYGSAERGLIRWNGSRPAANA